MKTSFKSTVGALAAVLALSSSAFAVSIAGNINFNGTPVVDTPLSFATSTRIVSFTDLAVGATHTGSYASVATNQIVTFASPIIYNAAVVPASPLWTFVSGGLTYSFSASSIVSAYSPSTNTWSIAGNGLASITGLDDTPGNYNLTITSSSTSSFSFAATTAVQPVPEGGISAILLGLSLVSVGLVARRVKKA